MTIHRNLKFNDWCEPEDEIKQCISIYNEDILGVFALKNTPVNYKYIIGLNYEEKIFFSNLKLKPNEIIVRYISLTTSLANQKPLIKINLEKGLVYYLKNYEIENFQFETRGCKVAFLRTIL